MAKRKASEVSEVSELDALSALLIDNVVKAAGGKTYTTQEMVEGLVGIPIPWLFVQYLMGVDILPMSRFFSLSGPPASYKSTTGYLLAILNSNYGVSFILNTELKPNPMMVKQLSRKHPNAEKRISWVTVKSLEALGSELNNIATKIEKLAEVNKKGKMPAVFVLVDSLSSCLSLTTQEAQKTGKQQGYDDAQAANHIKKLFLSFNARVESLPVVVCMVNHQHFKTNTAPGLPPEEYDAGGVTKDFVYSFRMITARPQMTMEEKADGEKVREIYLQVKKSTLALQSNGRHAVDLVSTKIGETETDRFAWFNFFKALTVLLCRDNDEKNKRPAMWAALGVDTEEGRKTAKLNIKKINKSKYTCPRYNNGEPMTPTDLGIAIQKDPEMVQYLQDHILGVQKLTKYAEPIGDGLIVPDSYRGDEVSGVISADEESGKPPADSGADVPD